MYTTKLIVTDLDNTLLLSDKSVSSYTAEVLNRCKEQNIPIVFATARPERAVFRFTAAIKPDYIISNNGATITHRNTMLYNKAIDSDISAKLLAELRDNQKITMMTAEVGHCLYTNYNGPPWEEGWNLVYNNFHAPVQEAVVKISTECLDVKTVQEILVKYSKLHLYANSGETWQQIMHKDVTKLNAIKFIANELKIDLADVVAFGDDYNDIEMLNYCGIGVAVGNAIPEAKKAADYICGSNDDDGVAHWLEDNFWL